MQRNEITFSAAALGALGAVGDENFSARAKAATAVSPEPAGALCLALLLRSDALAAALTDLESLARVDMLAAPAGGWRELRRRTRDALMQVAAAGPVLPVFPSSASGADEAIRKFGAELFAVAMPANVAQYLRDARPGALTLQLDSALNWLPWELLFDGQQFLAEKFRVCRRIANHAPRAPVRFAASSGALKVLMLAGGVRPAATTVLPALVARLRGMSGVALSAAHVQDLPRQELLRMISAADVVHYAGPVDGRPAPSDSVFWWLEGEPLDIAAIAVLEAVPQLLVSHDCAGSTPDAGHTMAANACALGLNVLVCNSSADGRADSEFLLSLYTVLLHGASLAEAVQRARANVTWPGGAAALAAMQPALYGDGLRVPHSRRAPSDDSLRQITIMSVDLVESTRLLAALGAEKYSDLLRQYHDRCKDILEAHNGMPDLFQGDDGAMCYFGVPVAREDAAVQALRAGLELIDAVAALGLGVRIGICTGQVVVRDGQPIGSAIHLAARLQSIAAPGAVVVGESTRRIVGERFLFQPLDQLAQLKGFDEPQACFRLLGAVQATAIDTRARPFDARPTILVGRDEELAALQAHWVAVKTGPLRVVRLLGEAGIGKSRLMGEFKRTLIEGGSSVFECRCAPEYNDSPFRSLIEALRVQLKLHEDDPIETVMTRIRRLLARTGSADEGAVALVVELLGIELATPHPVLAQTPERRRQLTIELLLGLVRVGVRHAPGCLMVDDIHWLDPSTAEFLDRVASDARALPVLVLVTARADVDVGWHPRIAVHEIGLQGLSPEASRALVHNASGTRELPPELVQLIASRGDGVPLFIEECTRMAVELGADRIEFFDTAMPVPSTVLDLLTARLDRLGSAKQVAQVGGTIGREFPLALLREVLAHPDAPVSVRDCDTQLDELIRAGMLQSRGDESVRRFVFRHALMRDAAYRSLLERDRVRLHRVIAFTLAQRFSELAQRHPELLAFHYTEAGMDAEALRSWEHAARQAALSSAHAEAIGHIGSALVVLARTPPGEERERLELRLQLLLAARLIATRGYGAERVERAYLRALDLARVWGDQGTLMRVLLGLEGYHFMRADFEKARTCVLDAARPGSPSSPVQQVQTQWALANIRMHQGEMEEAVREMDACRVAYQRLTHRPEQLQDPGVMCLCYSAWSLWQLGYPDEALRRVHEVVALAERLGHKFSLGESYGFRAAVLNFRGEWADALDSAERAVDICENEGFAVWLAHARIMRGRALAGLGKPDAGVEEMRRGYEQWAATGAVVTTPFYLAQRAEGLAMSGYPEDGLALLEQALSIVDRTGERYYEAEIRRLIGVLNWRSAQRAGLDRADEAAAWMLQALECARARKLASLALRAASSVAELWATEHRHAHALELLESAYNAVHGGAGTRDIVQAQQQLVALREAASP